jgi:hypothetical protein
VAAPATRVATSVLAPGAAWRSLPPAAKAERLRGYAAGLRAAAAELALADPPRARALEAQADLVERRLAELLSAVDRFYAAPAERRLVPLARVVRHAVAVAAKEPEPARWLAAPAAVPRLASPSGRIPVTALRSPYVKDPAFVDDGRPVAGHRYVAFGDLFAFYLKRFALAPTRGPGTPALSFDAKHVPITIAGFPAAMDAAWAPDLRVVGDKVVLLYCAGRMVKDLEWPTFRLRMAEAPLARFSDQYQAGAAVAFRDVGPVAADARPFGPGDADYGVIDPRWFVGPKGESHLLYTVVRHGVPGKRYHEEAIWSRPVDPRDPRRATGPDRLVYQGRANTPDDGVAEAQDVVAVGDRTYVFVSSRAGDRDQRLLVGPAQPGMGLLPEGALEPLMDPGGEPWKSNAVGSSGAAVIEGHLYMVHQGMDRAGRFSLGWTALTWPEGVPPR